LNYLLPHGPSTGKEKNGRSSSSSTRSRRRRVLREVCKRKRKRGKATRYSRSVGYVIGLGFFFMKQEGFYPLLEFIKVKSKVYSNNTSRDKKKNLGRDADAISSMPWNGVTTGDDDGYSPLRTCRFGGVCRPLHTRRQAGCFAERTRPPCRLDLHQTTTPCLSRGATRARGLDRL
jgi:hypothetical protein